MYLSLLDKALNYVTPLGLNDGFGFVCYNNFNPSGLFSTNIEADIQRGLKELKHLIQ